MVSLFSKVLSRRRLSKNPRPVSLGNDSHLMGAPTVEVTDASAETNAPTALPVAVAEEVVQPNVDIAALEKQRAAELAKSLLTSQMAAILERPEPASFECGCCGATNRLDQAELLVSRCIFTNLELRRFRCANCNVVFGPVALIQCSSAELGQLYQSLYSFYKEGATQRFQEKTFYLMNPSTCGEYLNYACGDWSLGVSRLRSIDWNVWGFEPFQPIQAEGIYNDRELLAGRQFNGLMTHNYIEHVQNPEAFFKECSSFIIPNGKMAHSSPCFDYVFDFTAFHLYFFCGTSVHRLAERTGFRVVGEYRTDQHISHSSYVCFVFEKVD